VPHCKPWSNIQWRARRDDGLRLDRGKTEETDDLSAAGLFGGDVLWASLVEVPVVHPTVSHRGAHHLQGWEDLSQQCDAGTRQRTHRTRRQRLTRPSRRPEQRTA
jgi:hypothetical protein